MAKKKTTSKKSAAASRATATKKSPPKTSSRAAKTSTTGVSQATTTRTTASRAAPRKPARRKTARHVNAWLELSSGAREELFLATEAAKMLDAIEASYTGDVVNALLDLRKAAVRDLLERLAGTRKRAMSEVVALYFYRDYLMDPFPMAVGTNDTPNYYAILGIPREADEDEIRTAHRMLSKAFSPEGFAPTQRKLAQERLEEIREAYEHLSPKRRDETDRQLPSMQYLYPRRDQSWLGSARKVLEYGS